MKTSFALLPLLAAYLIFTGANVSATPQADLVLNASDEEALALAIGKNISVQGTVLSVGKGTKDGIRFLDFSSVLDQGFVGVVFPVAYAALGPLESYVGKTVRVTGELQKYRAQTQIKILKPSQIEILP